MKWLVCSEVYPGTSSLVLFHSQHFCHTKVSLLVGKNNKIIIIKKKYIYKPIVVMIDAGLKIVEKNLLVFY